jgi:hypothetical protein
MFDVQYNRNTFNPHVRKSWVHAHRADTLEAARAYLRTTRAKFKNEFGYPSDVEYRIIEVKPAIEPIEDDDAGLTRADLQQFYGPSVRI